MIRDLKSQQPVSISVKLKTGKYFADRDILVNPLADVGFVTFGQVMSYVYILCKM